MKKYIFIFLVIFFFSCEKNEINAIIQNTTVNDVVVSKNHLGFPDVIYFDDIWYVVYRESDGHIGTYSIIKIVRSKDFVNWEEIFSYKLNGWDLRDPKFSYDQLNNKLYLHINATTYNNYGSQRKNLYIEYNQQLNNFPTDTAGIKEYIVPDKYQNIWLWRPEWNNGILYCVGYNPAVITGTALFTYQTITANPDVIPLLDYSDATEATIRFRNDIAYCLVRRDSHSAVFGTASLENLSKFNWSNIPVLAFGGPNMVLTNQFAFVGGRNNGLLYIGKLDLETYSLTELEKLPSSGDCSYPGMVIQSDSLYVVYYTAKNSGYAISSGKIYIKQSGITGIVDPVIAQSKLYQNENCRRFKVRNNRSSSKKQY